MTSEEVESFEGAYETVGYYIQRWKIEPFGPDFKNFIRSLTTVIYSILWVKFSALRRGTVGG
jgi:hypothetical protein